MSFARSVVTALVLVSLAGGGWVAVSRAKDKAQEPPRKSGPVSVRTALAEKGDMDVGLSALGTVTSLANVTVKTQIAGKVMEVGFQEGQEVAQGDFLAQIDPRPYENALAQSEGTLLKDQALLKEAEGTLARYQKLVAQDSLAKQQLDTQEALVQQYQGTVQSDKAEVETARLNLSYCRITAPIAGRAGLRLVDAGTYVQAGDSTGLVTVTQTKPISVLFTIPEDQVPALSARLNAEEKVAVEAFDRGQSRKIAEGTLTAANNQIDSTTGTLKIRATFANEDRSLFPNQFVNIRMVLRTVRDTVLVPSAAVQHGAPGAFVYLVQPDNKVAVRTIKVEAADGQKTSIASGLAAGDRVVVDGVDKLQDGAEITFAP